MAGPVQPFGRFVRSHLAELAGLDSRLLRTLRLLLLRPGRLTVEYLAGRRVRYVSPLRLYLATSFLTFLAVALLDLPLVEVHRTGEVPRDEVRAPIAFWFDPAEPGGADEGAGGLVDRALGAAVRTVEARPEAFSEAFTRHLPTALFLLAPFLALLLAALYADRRRLYAEHLIFSLHLHAAGFLVLLVAVAARDLLGTVVPGALLLAALGVYLFAALRRVYGGGVPRTLASLAALCLGWGCALGITVSGLALVVAALAAR